MSSILFGKKVDPKEQVRGWQRELRKQMRNLDRDSNKILREEKKIERELKKEVKNGNKKSAAILAKSIIRSRKAREQLLVTKTNINSVNLNLKQQLATIKVMGVMKQSAVIMKGMNAIMRTPQMMQIAQEMSKEMMKAGIIEELVDDTMSMMQDSDEEELADEEINSIIDELTQGVISADVGKRKINITDDEKKIEVGSKKDDEMQARLENL